MRGREREVQLPTPTPTPPPVPEQQQQQHHHHRHQQTEQVMHLLPSQMTSIKYAKHWVTQGGKVDSKLYALNGAVDN